MELRKKLTGTDRDKAVTRCCTLPQAVRQGVCLCGVLSRNTTSFRCYRIQGLLRREHGAAGRGRTTRRGQVGDREAVD